jgi:hypothetical protein
LIKLLNRDRVLVPALLVLVAIVLTPRLNGPIDLRWDAGVYYVLGTSLAEGKGYRLLNEPGEIQETQYPPLMPAIISGSQRLSGSSDPGKAGRLLRAEFLIVFGLFLLAAYALARRYLFPLAAFASAAFCLVNLYAHIMGDQASADLPFALTVTAFAFFASGPPGRANSALSGLFCAASYLLRTAGIALMAAWIGEAVAARRLRTVLLRAGVCFVPVAAWTWYVARVENSSQYKQTGYAYQRADYLFYNVSYARNLALIDTDKPELGRITPAGVLKERLLPNLWRSPVFLGEAQTSKWGFWDLQRLHAGRFAPPRRIITPILIVIGTLIIFGGVLHGIRHGPLVPLCVLFSAIMICATPWPSQMGRYFMPLIALSSLLLVEAVMEIRRILRARFSPMLADITVALGLVFLIAEPSATLAQIYRKEYSESSAASESNDVPRQRLFFYRPSYAALDVAVDWLRARARPTDILASSMPHTLYIRTGLHSVMFPFEREAARAQSDLDSVPVRFLISQRGDKVRYVADLVSSGAAWKRIYSDPEAGLQIYERTPF